MSTAFVRVAEPRVVYADGELVAILKPERMHTAPLAAGESPTLCGWAFARFPELARAAGPGARLKEEGGLLQRLDFETSGLVLFARSPEAYVELAAAQAAGNLRKEYLLRVAPTSAEAPRGSRPARTCPRGLDPGEWEEAFRSCLESGPDAAEPLEGLAALLRASASRGAPASVRSRFRPYGPRSAQVACLEEAPPQARGEQRRRREGTREAYSTEFLDARRVGAQLELRVGLVRGFRHQLRAHLAWVGLPIAGDPLYGGEDWPRLCLHAFRLVLRRPGGLETSIEC
ncbi:MAG TPA: RNA pseudouridine synthase [Rectinemataceae bacterium]|nr:RNA pseudouridine synthase [Rectinemataceae bacterium]